jgi:hypothetical protein
MRSPSPAEALDLGMRSPSPSRYSIVLSLPLLYPLSSFIFSQMRFIVLLSFVFLVEKYLAIYWAINARGMQRPEGCRKALQGAKIQHTRLTRKVHQKEHKAK